MRIAVAVPLVCSLVLTGCTALSGGAGGGERGDDTDAASTSTPALVLETAPASAPESPEEATVPDSTTAAPVEEVVLADTLTDAELRAEVEWVLDLIAPEAQGPDAGEALERLAPAFLEEVSLIQLGAVFVQLRAAGPYVVTRASQSEGVGRTATLTLDAAEQPLVLTLSLDDDGRIATLLFQPDTSGQIPTLSSWADLDDVLVELGGQSQVVVGRVSGGDCEVVHTTAGLPEGGEPAPSASVVKLLVLSAVAESVRAGDLAWEQELTLTAAAKSLPSGVLQNREDGSVVTVAKAAELMISISDNTATDLLIEAVGQRSLRTAAVQAGLDPVRVMPIPTTRQLFQLGWQVDPEVRTRWAQTQVPETREAILADLPDGLEVDPATITEPRWEDGVDWLLTGAEICGLHARLQQQAEVPTAAAVRDILALNPGIAAGAGVDYQAFKGGSAPGVLALSFYTEGDDPEEVRAGGSVLVIQTRSTEVIDQLRAVRIATAGLRQLASAQD